MQSLTAIACGAPVYASIASSNARVSGPWVGHPDRYTAETSAISSSLTRTSARGTVHSGVLTAVIKGGGESRSGSHHVSECCLALGILRGRHEHLGVASLTVERPFPWGVLATPLRGSDVFVRAPGSVTSLRRVLPVCGSATRESWWKPCGAFSPRIRESSGASMLRCRWSHRTPAAPCAVSRWRAQPRFRQPVSRCSPVLPGRGRVASQRATRPRLRVPALEPVSRLGPVRPGVCVGMGVTAWRHGWPCPCSLRVGSRSFRRAVPGHGPGPSRVLFSIPNAITLGLLPSLAC